MKGVDIVPIVFWGFIGLCFALMIGAFVYLMWTQPGWRPLWFRSRPNPSVAQMRAMRATKVPASLAAIFKVAAGICALLGLAVLAWLATLE